MTLRIGDNKRENATVTHLLHELNCTTGGSARRVLLPLNHETAVCSRDEFPNDRKGDLVAVHRLSTLVNKLENVADMSRVFHVGGLPLVNRFAQPRNAASMFAGAALPCDHS